MRLWITLSHGLVTAANSKLPSESVLIVLGCWIDLEPWLTIELKILLTSGTERQMLNTVSTLDLPLDNWGYESSSLCLRTVLTAGDIKKVTVPERRATSVCPCLMVLAANIFIPYSDLNLVTASETLTTLHWTWWMYPGIFDHQLVTQPSWLLQEAENIKRCERRDCLNDTESRRPRYNES